MSKFLKNIRVLSKYDVFCWKLSTSIAIIFLMIFLILSIKIQVDKTLVGFYHITLFSTP
jgi:hypothetical protein